MLFAPLANYVDGNFDALREMMLHPRTVLGLSDGGAHCGLICDASMPTYLLTHWVRDRTRGERIPLEHAVRLQTGNTAAVYGLHDRGTLAVGKKGDVNVIDLDALRLHAPEMVFDLPAGGRRLVQRVDGLSCDRRIGRGDVRERRSHRRAAGPAGARDLTPSETGKLFPPLLPKERAEVRLVGRLAGLFSTGVTTLPLGPWSKAATICGRMRTPFDVPFLITAPPPAATRCR